ncbi:MAG: hypothetical protein IKK87_10525 [Bacteroidaceae bacterium]|nr:hypothetical protein [Bacteroidaceae bacterium]
MKKIFTIAALMFVVFPVNAQKYMRYHMSDSTFHGFYTESIDSMEHTLSHSYVHMGGNTYEIPLDKVDSISFEGISVYDENVIGKYRIYELESDTLPYKKAYIDNRAMMIASRRGEFGANDTIVIASEYYNTKWMIMTNNDGDVEKFFDGKALFYFDYQSEGGFTVLRMADSICTTLELKAEDCNKVKARSSTVNKSLGKFLENIQAIGNKVDEVGGQFGKDHPIWDFAIPNGITEGLGWLTDVIDDVKNNPELHNQQLIVNGLEVTGDLAGICATLLAGIPTEGLAWTLLLSEVGLLATDVGELFEELFPDSDQMKAYKEYYQNKYNIFVRAEEPANITYSGATLKGTLSTSQNKNLGRAYFYFSELYSVDGRDVDANMNPVTNGGWLLEAPITNLKMNTTYLYFIVYECEVDGLNFTFISENSSDFTTHNLSLSDISAEDCYYYDGKVCYDMTATIESTKESLANYKECGVYYRNKKTGKTYIEKKATFSGYSETSEVSFPFYVDKEDFDVINHSLHHARSSNYSFGVYVETQDGNHELYDEQDFDFEYDKEPKVYTGEASSVSETEATVKCEFEDCLFWNALRGVEYFTDSKSGSVLLDANKEDGEYDFHLDNLSTNTTYNYRVYYEVDGVREYGETKSFETKGGALCNDGNHVHAVDLGLSVKWACCNVGASVPEGYGGYYAWGETEEKSDYDRDTYQYYIDTDGDGYKEWQDIGSNISGTSYDVAHVKWGGGWRMPTRDEIKELCEKCSWELTTVNGIRGYKVTGPNGNSIFLPAAGSRLGTEVVGRGSDGCYWSGKLYGGYSWCDACCLYFGSGYGGWSSWGNRGYGHPVRPVTD